MTSRASIPSIALRGDGVFLRRVLLAVVGHVVADHVVQAVPLRIPAGQNAPPRRRAGGPRHVEVRATHPLLRQPVEVRRLDLVAAEAAQIAIALVVADDQHDVRRPVCRSRRRAAEIRPA